MRFPKLIKSVDRHILVMGVTSSGLFKWRMTREHNEQNYSWSK